MLAVVYLTKVRIFLQITTISTVCSLILRCCLPYKGTNFSANHNEFETTEQINSAVVYLTKVRIFLQITTCLLR